MSLEMGVIVIMLSILLPGASAFMVGAMRVPTARCASAMVVDSRYDIKMAAEAAAANPPAGKRYSPGFV